MIQIRIFLLLATLTNLSSSSCCWDLSWDSSATCKDPRNTCNSLCCSCGSTCQVSISGTLINSPKTVMDMADRDGDRNLDVFEATTFLDFMGREFNNNKKGDQIPLWFKDMDVDASGKIQPLELDPDFFLISAAEKNTSRQLTRYIRQGESLWSCFHLVSHWSECIGAIISYVPCANVAKDIFDLVHTAIKSHGKDACIGLLESAVSLPIDAIGCATLGTTELVEFVAEMFTDPNWVKVKVATWVANQLLYTPLKMPAKLADWMGCRQITPPHPRCPTYSCALARQRIEAQPV